MYCCTKVTEDVIWIGINDRKTERFENYLPLDNGVTYNSYLIYDEKTCTIDAVEAGQSGSFYAKLENSLGGRNLDYLVVNHVEPDHSGAIKELFRVYPRSEEHTSELQSRQYLVCRLLLEKKKKHK